MSNYASYYSRFLRVTNHNAEVFPDPDAFKPERWVDVGEQQLKAMNNLWELNFGGGARKCIGRHISCRW